MKVGITMGSVLLLVLAIPQLGWPYYTILMLSFFAYATVLLGLNLLFGYTGLLSFGHALFLGLGAYTTAWLTSVWGIRSMEVILLTAMVAAVLVAAPIGALCARYVKIYFGMLTLAFGMLFYSFLLKFYHLTGGDEGMRLSSRKSRSSSGRGRRYRPTGSCRSPRRAVPASAPARRIPRDGP